MIERYITNIETNRIHSELYERSLNDRGHQYELIVPARHKTFDYSYENYKKEPQEITPESLVNKLLELNMDQVVILDHLSLSPTGEEEHSLLGKYVKAIQDSDYNGKTIVTYFSANESAMRTSLEEINLENILFLLKPHGMTELFELVERD